MFTVFGRPTRPKDAHFDDMAASYLKELLCLFSRELLEQRAPTHTPRTREVEDAVSFFNTHFNRRLNLSEYAARQNMSLCWFIHSDRSTLSTRDITTTNTACPAGSIRTLWPSSAGWYEIEDTQ